MEESRRGDGRHNSRTLNGNVLSSCVTPAYTKWTRHAMTLTDTQEEKVQVCGTDLVRRIVGVKGVDKRRMDELTVEVEIFKKELATSSLTWAGHAERMGDGKLTKRADAQKVEGKILMGYCLKET